MTTTNTNQTTKTNVDQHLTFDDSVIEKIAGINMFSEFADKVSSGNNMTKGINADVGEKQVAIKMDATIEYDKSAPEIFEAVCKEIDSALDKMTGLKLVKFELHVNDVKTREELKKDDDKQVS